jgi:hypothetical protein
MALAKTVGAQSLKKHKHSTEMTTDKLRAIALAKATSSGSLVKLVEVISLVGDLFGDLDRVF